MTMSKVKQISQFGGERIPTTIRRSQRRRLQIVAAIGALALRCVSAETQAAEPSKKNGSAQTARTEEQPPALVDVHSGTGSTLHGFSGTTPESPDGKRIVYVRVSGDRAGFKPNRKNEIWGEIWVANTDLTGHRKVMDVMVMSAIPHNGAYTTWIDNRRVGLCSGRSFTSRAVYVIDVDAETEDKRVLHGPIHGQLGHYAVNGKLPLLPLVELNAGHPVIDEPGLYMLDCDTGEVTKTLVRKHLVAHAKRHGLDPSFGEREHDADRETTHKS